MAKQKRDAVQVDCAMTPAKTPAERQAAFRARKIDLPEVRGVFAHPDDHARVKAYAAKVAKQRIIPPRVKRSRVGSG